MESKSVSDELRRNFALDVATAAGALPGWVPGSVPVGIKDMSRSGSESSCIQAVQVENKLFMSIDTFIRHQ